MSLVICSNQDNDSSTERLKSNLNQPWSFKNQLTSTYNIPKDAQVALQSCKVNIDGRIAVNKDSSIFYQYFGKTLNLDGVTKPQIEDTPYFPVLSSAISLDGPDQVKELSQEDFANSLQAGIRQTTFHPNKKDQTNVEVLRNGSNLGFLGYKITMDQNNANIAGRPADNSFEEFYSAAQVGPSYFTYTGGVFTRTGGVAVGDAYKRAYGICPKLPMNLCGGQFEVDIGGTSGRANASGVEWLVGLSRYMNYANDDGYYYPPYAGYDEDEIGLEYIDGYADFAICRNSGDQLIVFHSVWTAQSDGTERLVPKSIDYWNNASSYFNALTEPEDLTGKDYTDVRFEVTGERVKAEIYDNASSAWRTITEYRAGEAFNNMCKPVPQTAWCLHPVLGVGVTESGGGVVTNGSCTLQITTFNDVDISSGYDPTEKFKGGWYETMELNGTLDRTCELVDSRDILTAGNTKNYAQVGLNASNKVDLDNVLIVLENDIYYPSDYANTKELLGFTKGVIDVPYDEPTPGKQIFQSLVVPDTVSSLSLFVRLDNFNQSVKNARVGNHSKILAHLTDLETKVGRQTYEPNNLVWLDLGNTNELNITEFSLSFCYVNEQYATILTGQSICCLYFREKPK